MKNKAVFLDRDGTLNKVMLRDGKSFPPRDSKDFEILAGVKDAIDLFESQGYIPIVVTNQPDFARGTSTLEQIDSLNNMVREKLNIKHIYTCLHDDQDDCLCRKPKPGLLVQAAHELNIELTASIMIGDRWRDIQAGQLVGCSCYYIDCNYMEPQPQQPFERVLSLFDAAKKIGSIHDI